jgi:hypothetical protein
MSYLLLLNTLPPCHAIYHVALPDVVTELGLIIIKNYELK